MVISNRTHLIGKILSLFDNAKVIKKPVYVNGDYHHSIKYYEVPCAFDIETTSFYDGKNKRATMYIWQFGINDYTFVGRTWEEFLYFTKTLCEVMELNDRNQIIVYVHNLSYEFQWIRKYFQWEKVFALDSRKPVQAVTTCGIDFRCSYILSGYSLQKVGEHLTKYKVTKKVGQLDYNLKRHSQTPIDPEEMEYCVDDVRVVMCFIREEIERNGSIIKIPLTKTGYVRRECRNACFFEDGKATKKSKKRKKYHEVMKALTLGVDEYRQLQRAFQGGFTHANPLYVDTTLTDIFSYDETSAYPTVMVAEQFPMSKSEVVEVTTREDLEHNIKLYCCLFDVEFVNLRPKIYYENYISLSRCFLTEKPISANGRIVSAQRIQTTITETDYRIIEKCYTWDKMRVWNFRRYRKGYLPTDFVKAILSFYGDKTKLKGIEGKEVEYLHQKENVNSCYGMMVTNICRPENPYDDQWLEPIEPNAPTTIEKYNNDKNRFLFYPWGVWVTAYARRNLWTGIFECGTDYVYSDTDSVKARNREKHLPFFESYNKAIIDRLEKAMDYHGLPRELVQPKTIYGESKPLGVWDYEGTYSRFKTEGAKRYMTEKDNVVSLTVSGVNKKVAIPYLLDTYGKCGIFDHFSRGLTIDGEHCGKLTHTYIDEPVSGTMVDYLGNIAEYHEQSFVHLEPSGYSMSIAEDFINYIKGVQNGKILQSNGN